LLHLQVDPADVVIVEGILVLHEPELRDILNMKIYVDTGGRLSTFWG
jgi:uridine kinase